MAKIPLVAHATADVLSSDPVTIGGPRIFNATRPRRSSAAFAAYLDRVPLWNAKSAATANRVLLEDTSRISNSELSACARLRPVYQYKGNVTPYGPRREPTNSRPSTLMRGRANSSGVCSPADSIRRPTCRYLKFPLAIHYRGGIVPGGRDSKTINAQVRWISLAADASGAAVPGTAEVSFALADLRLRQPLGVAADARWAWHEWSHVMLAGATGSLEFEFAHSAGDALAAIIADPDSALAAHSKWRGRTFPWVSLPGRSHSRDVREGWGWTGTLYQRERYFAAARHLCEKNPYWSEQIHSSSLFRLYRALGGDTESIATGSPRPDRDVRRSVELLGLPDFAWHCDNGPGLDVYHPDCRRLRNLIN